MNKIEMALCNEQFGGVAEFLGGAISLLTGEYEGERVEGEDVVEGPMNATNFEERVSRVVGLLTNLRTDVVALAASYSTAKVATPKEAKPGRTPREPRIAAPTTRKRAGAYWAEIVGANAILPGDPDGVFETESHRKSYELIHPFVKELRAAGANMFGYGKVGVFAFTKKDGDGEVLRGHLWGGPFVEGNDERAAEQRKILANVYSPEEVEDILFRDRTVGPAEAKEAAPAGDVEDELPTTDLDEEEGDDEADEVEVTADEEEKEVAPTVIRTADGKVLTISEDTPLPGSKKAKKAAKPAVVKSDVPIVAPSAARGENHGDAVAAPATLPQDDLDAAIQEEANARATAGDANQSDGEEYPEGAEVVELNFG